MVHADALIVLAVLFSFFMAWGVGANDVANAMGTSVGSKALTIGQAIVVAAIFEALGSLMAGSQVTETIRGQIINPAGFIHHPNYLVYGMLASLLAAGSWLLIASSFGWPVSTTHTIVGAVIGFGLVSIGSKGVYWQTIISITLSWIVTPMIALVIAFLLFRSVQYFIFESEYPLRNAKRYVPWYIFMVSMVITLVTFLSGLKHTSLAIPAWEGVLFASGVSFSVTGLGWLMLRKIRLVEENSERVDFKKLENIFGILMIFAACAMAFAHGSNDVANAIGPLAAVISIVKSNGQVLGHSPIPWSVMLLGAIGIVCGLAMYGHKVIATIGKNITQLTPSRGFAAQLATASTVVVASGLGLPISTTQTLVGAVLGVGVARGMAALNLSVIRNIFISWVITLPAGAALAIVYYFCIKLVFSFF